MVNRIESCSCNGHARVTAEEAARLGRVFGVLADRLDEMARLAGGASGPAALAVHAAEELARKLSIQTDAALALLRGPPVRPPA